MNFEASKIEEEKKRIKKKELSDEEKKRIINEEKRKEYIQTENETSEHLDHLRNLLEHHQIDEATIALVQKIASDSHIDSDEMKEVLDLINSISENINIAKYLPKDLIVGKDEYIQALHNDEKKKQTLTKLNSALWVLARHITPSDRIWISLIGWLTMLLDKNLVVIQEAHIDLRNNLIWEEKKKWFIATIKEIFTNT